MNIGNIFNVYIRDMKQLFSDDQGKCFFIPAYQRPYTWGIGDVERTWQDIVYGLEQLDGDSDDYITFLGSIITMHDANKANIPAELRRMAPASVMLIVDGQQRLATMLLLIISLNNEINLRLTRDTRARLENFLDILRISDGMYKSQKGYGNRSTDIKNYPKIIRAYADQWSTDNRAQYASPIASFLNQYIQFVDRANENNELAERFEFDENEPAPYDGIASNEIIKANANAFVKLINEFLEEKKVESFKEITNISVSLGIEKELNKEVKALFEEDSIGDNNRDVYILLLVLSFVVSRVYVAEIIPTTEDYAFELFDSLNTTGDPLTAFETFKPKVIQFIGLAEYVDSEAKKNIDKIEEYLNFEPKNREKITSTLITAFALSETGFTLPKKLRDQRIYLRDRYKDNTDKEGFVKNIYNVSSLYHIWNQSNGENLGTTWKKTSDEELVDIILNDDVAVNCLGFLSKVGHVVSLPILTRFSDKNPAEFVGAIKAITAFFVLWRSARPSTAGIDNLYRKLMSQGVDLPTLEGDTVTVGAGNIKAGDKLNAEIMESLGNARVPAFNRVDNHDISLEELQIAFRFYLYKGATDNIEIFSKKTWCERLKTIEIYNVNRKVCKFLLITAFDNVVSIPESKGLVQPAREGAFASTLNRRFNFPLFETVEHISPDTNGWPGVSGERKHTLGNLTLLPQINNSSISDRPLNEKELIFRALCAETQHEQDEILEHSEISFHENTKQILVDSQHFPYLKSLSSLEGWNDQIIESRTENLGGIIWDKLAVDWLRFKK